MKRGLVLSVISLSANAALATVLLWSRVGGLASVSGEPETAGTTLSATPAPSVDSRAEQKSASTARVYFQYLSTLGLTDDETKPLVLSHLELQALPDAASASLDRYWEPDFTVKRLAADLALAEKRESVRTGLIEVYGKEAELDPLLGRAFRPLDAAYAFLGPAQQIALQQHQLKRQLQQVTKRAAAGVQPARFSIGVPGERGGPDADQRSMAEDLGEFLDADSLAEVLYRYSPLAEQIRSARVQLTEPEFREAFRQLQRLDRQSPQPAVYLEVRASLRQLGPERFTRLWAARDPLYAAIVASAQQFGFGADTALAAYRIFNDSQETVMKAAQLRTVDPERSRVEVQDAMSAQQTKLAALLGPDVADGVLRIQSELALRLSGQDGRSSRAPSLSPTSRAGKP